MARNPIEHVEPEIQRQTVPAVYRQMLLPPFSFGFNNREDLIADSEQLDPRWDPIREQPRFQALLAKYEN